MPISATQHQNLKSEIHSARLRVELSEGFSNYAGTSTSRTALVADVADMASLESLLKIIQELNANLETPLTISAAAGGKGDRYSQSYTVNGPAAADIVIRLTGEAFYNLCEVNPGEKTVTVGPNVQIGQAESVLAGHGLALPTSPLNPYLTCIGLAVNGGIGTGKDQPSFPGLLVSLEMRQYDGSKVIIDRSDPEFATLTPASLGLLGIVVKATFQCTTDHRLRLVETPMSVPALLTAIEKHGLLTKSDFTSIYLVPVVKDMPDKFNARVYQWDVAPENGVDLNLPSSLEYYWQAMIIAVLEMYKVASVLNALQQLIPYFLYYIVQPLTVGYTACVREGPAAKLLHHQVAYPKDEIEDGGWALPVDNKGTTAAKAIRLVLGVISEYMRRGQCPITTGGIYIRRIKGTAGGISMCSGEGTLSIDVVSNIHAPGLRDLQQELSIALEQQFGARPHWGKFLREGYVHPNANNFVASLHRFYEQRGLSVARSPFVTAFHTQRLGIKKRSEPTVRDDIELEEVGGTRGAAAAAAEYGGSIVRTPLDKSNEETGKPTSACATKGCPEVKTTASRIKPRIPCGHQ